MEMTRENLRRLAKVGQDETAKISNNLNKPVTVDGNARYMLARIAVHKDDPEQFIRDRINIIINDMLRKEPNAAEYHYEYEPADADTRRQATCQNQAKP